MGRIQIEFVRLKNERFDGRPYWSATCKVGGKDVVVEWVAEGKKHMTAEQFVDHAEKIFNKLSSLKNPDAHL